MPRRRLLKLVDVEAMREMAAGCGRTLPEFVDWYLDGARAEMERLQEAVQAGSAAETARLAHGLAGSSVTAGVPGMATVLEEIERGAAGEDVAGLMRAAERRLDEVAEVLRRLRGA